MGTPATQGPVGRRKAGCRPARAVAEAVGPGAAEAPTVGRRTPKGPGSATPAVSRRRKKAGRPGDADKLHRARQTSLPAAPNAATRRSGQAVWPMLEVPREGSGKEACRMLGGLSESWARWPARRTNSDARRGPGRARSGPRPDDMFPLPKGPAQVLQRGWRGRGRKRVGGRGAARPGPESRTATAMYDSHVKQKNGPGTSTIAGWAGGPNLKGDVQVKIQQRARPPARGKATRWPSSACRGAAGPRPRILRSPAQRAVERNLFRSFGQSWIHSVPLR